MLITCRELFDENLMQQPRVCVPVRVVLVDTSVDFERVDTARVLKLNTERCIGVAERGADEGDGVCNDIQSTFDEQRSQVVFLVIDNLVEVGWVRIYVEDALAGDNGEVELRFVRLIRFQVDVLNVQNRRSSPSGPAM